MRIKLDLSNTVLLYILANMPLFSYLMESFIGGKDKNEELTFYFGIILLFVYFLQFIFVSIISIINNSRIHSFGYLIFFILVPIALIGVINSHQVSYTLLIFIQVLTLVIYCNFINDFELPIIKKIIITYYEASVIGFVFFALLHYFISKGDYLFTLAQIQMPIFYLLYLITVELKVELNEEKKSSYLIFLLYLIIVYLGYSRSVDLAQFRVQFLPIGLFVLINILLLPNNIIKFLFPIFILGSFLMYDEVIELTSNRAGSFSERVSIFIKMAIDSSYFLVPQGLGSNNQLFDINELENVSQSSRVLYPPHSGIAAILYDFSIVPFLLLIGAVFIYKFSCLMFAVKTCNVKTFFSKLFTVTILTVIIENIFYLKSVTVGATFSDDFIYPLSSIIILYIKINKKIIFNFK